MQDFADGGVPGAMGGGCTFDIGESKNLAFLQTRKFSKNVKKSMKKVSFLKILKEIFRFFENTLRFYRNFRKNLWKNFGNMDF